MEKIGWWWYGESFFHFVAIDYNRIDNKIGNIVFFFLFSEYKYLLFISPTRKLFICKIKWRLNYIELFFYILTFVFDRFPKFPSIDKKDTSRLGNDGHGKKQVKTYVNILLYYNILYNSRYMNKVCVHRLNIVHDKNTRAQKCSFAISFFFFFFFF